MYDGRKVLTVRLLEFELNQLPIRILLSPIDNYILLVDMSEVDIRALEKEMVAKRIKIMKELGLIHNSPTKNVTASHRKTKSKSKLKVNSLGSTKLSSFSHPARVNSKTVSTLTNSLFIFYILKI